MIFFIIVFVIAIITAFIVLDYRVWQMRNSQEVVVFEVKNPASHITLRKIELGILHFLKYCMQKVIIISAKYWFLATAKSKKFISERWPKIHSIFQKKTVIPSEIQQPSFFAKALMESKIKVRHLRKKIKEDHAIEVKESEIESKE